MKWFINIILLLYNVNINLQSILKFSILSNEERKSEDMPRKFQIVLWTVNVGL